jgi:transaldolase
MPEDTIEQYHDHGQPQPRLEHDLAHARTLIDQLTAAGVNYDDITETLEREGVKEFADAFGELLAALADKARTLADT